MLILYHNRCYILDTYTPLQFNAIEADGAKHPLSLGIHIQYNIQSHSFSCKYFWSNFSDTWRDSILYCAVNFCNILFEVKSPPICNYNLVCIMSDVNFAMACIDYVSHN